MPRPFFLLALALIVAACDPAVGTTLLLAPTTVRSQDPSRAANGGAPPIPLSAALDAVERVAGHFGLESLPPGRCPHAWQGNNPSSHTFLHICATALSDGGLRLLVGEGLTTHWSARGDSLRQFLKDTLAEFGRVQTVTAP